MQAEATAARSEDRREVATERPGKRAHHRCEHRRAPAGRIDQRATGRRSERDPAHQRGERPRERLGLGAGRRGLAGELVPGGDDRRDEEPRRVPAATPSPPSMGATSSGRKPSGNSNVRRWWTSGSGERRTRAPYTNPPIALPIDQVASSTPASSARDWSWLNAGTATSSAPIAKPTGTIVITSVRMPGARRTPSNPASPWRTQPAAGRAAAATRTRPRPSSTVAADTTSAAPGAEHRDHGNDDQRRAHERDLEQHRVERVGGRDERRLAPQQLREPRPQHRGAGRVQRARRDRRPRPAPRPARRRSPARARRGCPAAFAAASGTSTRAPRRSTSRPMNGAPTPVPSASAPATAPGTANDPVCSRRNRTTASPLMPIGRRATSAAANSPAIRGWRRMRA